MKNPQMIDPDKEYKKVRGLALARYNGKPAPTIPWLTERTMWLYKWRRITTEQYNDLVNILTAINDPRYDYNESEGKLYDTITWEEVL